MILKRRSRQTLEIHCLLLCFKFNFSGEDYNIFNGYTPNPAFYELKNEGETLETILEDLNYFEVGTHGKEGTTSKIVTKDGVTSIFFEKDGPSRTNTTEVNTPWFPPQMGCAVGDTFILRVYAKSGQPSKNYGRGLIVGFDCYGADGRIMEISNNDTAGQNKADWLPWGKDYVFNERKYTITSEVFIKDDYGNWLYPAKNLDVTDEQKAFGTDKSGHYPELTSENKVKGSRVYGAIGFLGGNWRIYADGSPVQANFSDNIIGEGDIVPADHWFAQVQFILVPKGQSIPESLPIPGGEKVAKINFSIKDLQDPDLGQKTQDATITIIVTKPDKSIDTISLKTDVNGNASETRAYSAIGDYSATLKISVSGYPDLTDTKAFTISASNNKLTVTFDVAVA